MHTYNRNGVQIEQCSGCRGIFLDYGELEALARLESQWSQPAPPPQAYPAPPAPAWGAPQGGHGGGHGGGHYGGHHGGHHGHHKSFGHMLFSS
ncbi:zf-TFIIB domain containing protein [Streptomyces mangrovisoli]|uniref:Zf-TFIIB domain containing protein n=2 Tax=Streptomyces mangrovisoli TaxID=1428628 RepID=A0A1J4NVZ4_9ACTN|nr:zf-TFIIB domain containing protein [Streptomyces mangrovisoli]